MALAQQYPNQSRKDVSDSRRREEANRRIRVVRDDEVAEVEVTAEQAEAYEILRYCRRTFDDARKARRAFETWDDAWALFNGEMWRDRRPDWRASITINKIRAMILFMVAIMTDNKPRISVEPQVPGTEDAADLLRKLVDRDWDENSMQDVITVWVLWGLIWGSAFIKVWYDPYADGGRGKHMATPIPPYKIFTNPSATCIEDAEYIIHVEEVTLGYIRRNYPTKALECAKLKGVRTDQLDDQERKRDFVKEGLGNTGRISSAMNINGNIIAPQATMTHPRFVDEDRETIEIAEYHLRDDSLEEYKYQVVENGQGKFEPELEGGLPVMQVVGQRTIVSEIDGQPVQVPVRAPKMKPVMTSGWRRKYPNGRLVVVAGGKVLLRDIPAPYQTDGFPFAMWKDTNVGGFWGQGEPLQLRSMAFAINKLASNVFEILEKTGNPSWKVKKDGGVNLNAIKNKPGLVIAMDDVGNLAPLEKPPIPGEFFELFKLVSGGMGEVSGVNDSIRGTMPAANTSFAAVDQLTEAGSAPIRLKVRNMETGLARFGKLRIALIQQYDNGSRPLRATSDDDAPGVVQPQGNVAVKFTKYTNVDLQGQIEFKVEPISSLSTSPANAWNKWLTMLDKGLVDKVWWHSQQRINGYKTQLPRMLKQEAAAAAQDAALKKASKVNGTKSANTAPKRKQPPPSNAPTRQEVASAR